MAEDLAIQQNVMDDLIAHMQSEGLTYDFGYEGQKLAKPSYPVVLLNILNNNAELGAGKGASGFERLDVEITAQTYNKVDTTGDAARAILKEIRETIAQEDILDLLNDISEYNTYYYVVVSSSDQSSEGSVHDRPLTITIYMRPSNEK